MTTTTATTTLAWHEVVTSNGMTILVDRDDAGLVRQHRWRGVRGSRTAYVITHVRRADGRRTTQRLHTMLTSWTQVDHINGNGLDNRRANLRPATSSENSRNRRKRLGTTSRFVGVTWRKACDWWVAQIEIGGKGIQLGTFDVEADAARAYDVAARKAYGAFAALNFPGVSERSAIDCRGIL